MTALLASYPEKVLRYISNPVIGVPSKYKFLPTIAELKTELEAAAGLIQADERRLATPLAVPATQLPRGLETDDERLRRLDEEFEDCYWGPDEDIQPGDRVNFERSKGQEAWKFRLMSPEERAARPRYRRSDWVKEKSKRIPQNNDLADKTSIEAPPEEEPNPFLAL